MSSRHFIRPCADPRLPAATPWPLPALLAWAAGWVASFAALAGGAGPALALAAGALASAALAWANAGHWRRLIAAAGFPLSAFASGWAGNAAALPPWAWLALLAPLLLAYPLRAWRDAPFFPTPAAALDGIAAVVAAPRRVLDAGCGLGHGLAELHRAWPTAELHGIESSPALAWAAALRCRLRGWPARLARGDMWAASWAGCDLVYLFQRPESMARAFDKAARELAPGAFLASLEFAVPGQPPFAVLQGGGRRPVWIYKPADIATSAAATAARHGGSTTGDPGR